MNQGEETFDRWVLLRDVLAFQGKLLVDGAKDILLSPISIGAAILDFISGDENRGQNFYKVILLGRRTERWIGLFSAADHLDDEATGKADPKGMDALVKRLEGVVVQEYERGGITTKTKDAVDNALDRLLAQKPKVSKSASRDDAKE